MEGFVGDFPHEKNKATETGWIREGTAEVWLVEARQVGIVSRPFLSVTMRKHSSKHSNRVFGSMGRHENNGHAVANT